MFVWANLAAMLPNKHTTSNFLMEASATCGVLSQHCSLAILSVLIAMWVTLGCGNPHAVLNFTAPSTATAGSPFTVTVTVTIGEKRDSIVNSVITFTSSDPVAVLPGQYQFTPADAGSHTWTEGFVLKTPGNQTISATMFDAKGINGTANIAVSP